MPRTDANHVQPLLVRDSVRYTCHGDGVCCSDAHALGPITRDEKKRLRLIGREMSVVHHDVLDIDVFDTKNGGCVSLDGQACTIHRDFGANSKPATCRRFPIGLIATPSGGRVTTDHRCPCRTMGERAELVASDAHDALTDSANRLFADARAPERFAIGRRKQVNWVDYLEFEAEWTHRLLRTRVATSAFGVTPYPRIEGLEWTDAAHILRSRIDGTAGTEALAFFGDALFMDLTGKPIARKRPWSAAFDRAEARSKLVRDPNEMLIDWLRDQVWSLRWTERMTWTRAAAELTTRVHIAQVIADFLSNTGTRADRAMAEALLVVEITGLSSLWANLIWQTPLK